MKIYISILLFCCFYSVQAQQLSLETILIKTEKALSKIKNGYYEFEKKIHWLEGDITIDTGIFYFDNSVKGKKLVFEEVVEGTKLSGANVFNIKQGFYRFNNVEKTYIKNTEWYEPVAQLKYYTEKTEFLTTKALQSTIFTVKQLPDTVFNKELCFQIQYNFIDTKETTNKYHKVLINQNNFLPVRLETYLYDPVYKEKQYTRFSLLKKGFNQSKYKKEVANIVVPNDYKDITEELYKPKPEIKIGDTLPDFAFKNLPNYDINFASIKQDYILLDFWYIGCFPCVLVSPFVDSLAKTYDNKNLFVLGVNPYDIDVAKISEFKKKKNINYPNILIDIKTADFMRIVSYPTIAIIERKTRKVVYVQRGYSEEMKPLMVDFIDKNVVK